jgi:hypothetical protein
LRWKINGFLPLCHAKRFNLHELSQPRGTHSGGLGTDLS